MRLKDSEKASVLISALEERYEALRTIRERVQNIGLWALGILVTAGGWLLQSSNAIANDDRWIAISGLLLALVVLRWVYLSDLEKGFAAQQRVAARIERALGLYESGIFDQSGRGIYPSSWSDAGTGAGKGQFFASTYRLLYVGTAILTVVILNG